MNPKAFAVRGAWPLAALFALCACVREPEPAATNTAPVALSATPSASAVAEVPAPPAVSATVAVVPTGSSSSSPPPAEPSEADRTLLAAKEKRDKKSDDDDEGDAKEEVDPKNKAKPKLTSKQLTSQGKALFRAVKDDKPDVAKDFFFPRDPFLPLKDIKNPGKYWDQLFHVYEKDIHELHKKHAKDWEDAEFVSFELGSTPTWVKPGEEANKIGYFRTFNAKLHYKARDKERVLEVKTIISWNKRWFITHLLPFKKK